MIEPQRRWDMHASCPVCKGTDIFARHIINGFTILQCRSCGLLFVGEKLSHEELNSYYEKSADDHVYTDPGNIENLKYYYSELNAFISKRMSPGKILDVGCSEGHFLDCMDGWKCHGIEPGPRYARKAQEKYGRNIHTGTLEDYECPEGYFDVIALQDVLDHMPDPMTALKKCNILLKPGGLIIVKVHDMSSFFARLMGPGYYALIPPYHLVYYNKKNIIASLKRCGFEAEECRYIAHVLFLKTMIFRLAQNRTESLWYRLYRLLDRSPLGKIKIKKNLFDIITVFAKKV